jgi:hypothetical protein
MPGFTGQLPGPTDTHPLYTGYTNLLASAAMELTYLSPRETALVFRDDRNRNIEDVDVLLDQLEKRGASIIRIDPSALSPEERLRSYSRAIIPAVYKKYEVKRVFGTNRHSACWFGVQVPALIVKRNAQDIVGDTFPHRVPPNSIITIHDFLTSAFAIVASATRVGK